MTPTRIQGGLLAGALAITAMTVACRDDDTGGSVAALCEEIRAADTRLDQLNSDSEAGGQQARDAADELVELADGLLAAAPTELKPDYAVVRATFVGFRAELEAVDFDVARLPDQSAAAFNNPAFSESTGRLDAYTEEHCDGASLGD